MIQPASLALPLVALLLSCFCLLFSAAEAPKSYLDAFGQHTVLADKLAELVGAEEPLLPADLARLTSEVRCEGWIVALGAAAHANLHLLACINACNYLPGSSGDHQQAALLHPLIVFATHIFAAPHLLFCSTHAVSHVLCTHATISVLHSSARGTCLLRHTYPWFCIATGALASQAAQAAVSQRTASPRQT